MRNKKEIRGSKALKGQLLDIIMAECQSRSALATFSEDQGIKLSDREKLTRHVKRALRWSKIYEIFGFAGILFLDCLPMVWMAEESNDTFESRLEILKGKRQWLWKAVHPLFGKNDTDHLFHVDHGMIP